jgi:glucosamine 6-phosphate synthetase-like amidotransferase/phosphosugar isomerase protein
MAGVEDNLENFKCRRIIIVACGTSWHAGLVAEYILKFARISVEVEYASEFRYRNPIINSKDVVIAISQSGETADTMAAKLAKESGALYLGFVMLWILLFQERPMQELILMLDQKLEWHLPKLLQHKSLY